MRLLTRFLIPLAFLAVAAGCSSGDSYDPAKGVSEVTRQVLAESSPPTAPGQTVVLSRVVIPPGQGLEKHTHPGVQMATIAQGTLTYTVFTDSVPLTRASGSTETIRAGQTVELKPGDTITEPTGMQHMGENKGKTAVVIYLSSLFPAGAPAASLVD